MKNKYPNYLGGLLEAKIQFAKDLLFDMDYISYHKRSFFHYGVINVSKNSFNLSQYRDLPSSEFIKKYIKENKIYDKIKNKNNK